VTAIAANMAVLGNGTDTGNSIRMPAATSALVGVFPTRGSSASPASRRSTGCSTTRADRAHGERRRDRARGDGGGGSARPPTMGSPSDAQRGRMSRT
jgi:hypothetical protein